MGEGQRQDFLDQFTADSQGVGFAVLGGAFGEGIDLPGARLIGAFIATLGLAQLNPVNEQLKQRMAAIFGAGYDYTYLFPGVQKVVQAAGRVIRTQQDQGVVMLIDDRFGDSKVKQLLPRWWSIAPTDFSLCRVGFFTLKTLTYLERHAHLNNRRMHALFKERVITFKPIFDKEIKVCQQHRNTRTPLSRSPQHSMK